MSTMSEGAEPFEENKAGSSENDEGPVNDAVSVDSASSEGFVKADRFGFMITSKNHNAPEIDQREDRRRRGKEAERTKKWLEMLENWDVYTTTKADKLKSRIRKGIPDAVRGVVWSRLAGVEAQKEKMREEHKFENLVARLEGRTDLPDQDIYDTIERDIDRTFPRHILFGKKSVGRQALRNMLHAYSILDPELGYCQGMGFIAGLLLTYLPPDDAFYAFVVALNRDESGLRNLYMPGMIGAQRCFFVADRLLHEMYPRLHAHLERCGVHISMYATQWFMTLYSNAFPFEMVTRVWDIFWNEGWKIVYRVALYMLRSHQPVLMAHDMEGIMMFFRQLPETIDGVVLIEGTLELPLKSKQLAAANAAYDESRNS